MSDYFLYLGEKMATQTTSNCVQQLDQAKSVIVDLETELDSELSEARNFLCYASEWISDDSMYNDYLEEAMGRTVGIAIRTGHDGIAADAADLMDDPEDPSD